MLAELPPELYPMQWGGTYADMVAFLRDALERVVAKFPYLEDDELRADLVQRFRELCEPDPTLRGHPRAHAMRFGDRYSLDRYVSRFNALARRAEHQKIKITAA
jgi:hypothetical protein